MTLQEIKERIAAYESKWGKLGHTNIMKPENEIQHSALNERRNTMIKTTNDFYKFRQKVAIGKEANKLAHKATISPEELNERNFQNQLDNNTLIHAQNPLYGRQNPNAKYYKREGEPGNYRYYYTKEEYDAAHKQGSAQTDANREAQARQEYENNKKATVNANKSAQNRFNNMKGDVVNEYAKIARESSSKDAAKAFYDMAKGGNEAIDELYSTIQDGFKSGKLSYKDGRFETADDQLREDIEAFSDNIQKFAKQIGEASGKGREIQDELEKLMLPDIEDMSKKAEERKEISRKNDAGRDAAIKAGQKAERDRQEKAEIQRKNDLRKEDSNTEKILDEVITRLNTNYKGFRNKLDEALPDSFKKSKGSFNYEYKNKEYDDKIKEVSRKWNDLNNDRDEEGNIKHLDEMNKLSSEWADLENAKNKAKYSELMSAISSVIEDYSPSEKRNIYSDLAYFLNGPGYTSRYKEDDFKINAEVKDFLNELAAEDSKPAKHSAFDEEDETPSYKTAADLRQEREESIMSEYRAFKARANKGAEKNRLSHSTVISPRDLNAKYEEELMKEYIAIHPENDDDIEHSSNGRAYINKIDKYYPDGSARYFYTQAEWDAYQEGLKRSNYNADKEADARQAKIDKQKADLARRSGMENYAKYQENKKADEEADARQAKIDKQKTRAKQKAGMEGYEQYQQDKKTEAQKADIAKRQGMEGREEWDKEQKAEKEANAKKVAEDRNDMSGYAAWKRRRDYINNQKKASEAADAEEAEKHEIEKKAVKNSTEVAKNKAAAKAQEAAEAEKHEAESAERLAEERAAKAKKDTESKEASIKAGQESASKLHAENEARDKEHEKDVETRKLNEKYERLDNNIKNIIKNTSDKYNKQIEGLNNQLKSMDGSSPEAKEIQRKISNTNVEKDKALDKELSTIIEDLGELYQQLDDKNGAEAQKLKAAAEKLVKDNNNLGPITNEVINNLQKTVLPDFFTHLRTGARKF